MKNGICKLCDQKKQLKNSHVIGRAVFRKALNGQNYALRYDKNDKKIIRDQDQWATYMLCGDCEHKLNISYENYALNLLRNRIKSVKHKEKNTHYELQGVNQKKLILYLLSVLWRGIESEHIVFNELNILGHVPIVKNLLKESIKNEHIYFSECYEIRISKLVHTIESLKLNELNFISGFTYNVDEIGRIRFLVMFEGFCFEFFFLTDATQIVLGLGVLKKNKRILKMPYIDIFTIPEFNKSFIEMIDSQKKYRVL